jgi:crossover junction endodeoxyribonuclease RuvC
MRILGLDPGLRLTGYGCIEIADEGEPDGVWGGECRLVEGGVFRLGGRGTRDGRRGTTGEGKTPADRSAASVSARLVELERDLTDALERLKPDVVAVESLFAHYKHPATAIIMGHARGVILLAIRKAGIDLREFKPNEVKKSLTGHGHAEKGQMQRAIAARFGLAGVPKPPDVADAIAIALCAATRRGGGGVVPPRARSRKAAERALLARAVS